MAKEMKTLNGYEVVDQVARDKISNLSTEVNTQKITLRSNYNNIIGEITAKEYDIIDDYQTGQLINITGPSNNTTQLFERGHKVPTLVTILKRNTEMEVNTTPTILRFDGATILDRQQGTYVGESDGYGYFRISRYGAYRITVRVLWSEVSKNTSHVTGVAINNKFINEIDYCTRSFTNYSDISEFTTILILNSKDTVKLLLSSTMTQKARLARMYIERVA